jgi:hypothetical protein
MAKPITMAVSTRACGIGSAVFASVEATPAISTGSLSTFRRPMLKMNRLTA